MFLFLFNFLTVAEVVFAAPSQFNFQARIKNASGVPVESSSVSIVFTYLNSAKNCTLYKETFSNVDMTGSGGVLNLQLGSGTRAWPTSGSLAVKDIFSNYGTTFNCLDGSTYTSSSVDLRYLVMQFTYSGSGGWNTLTPISINSVPYSMYATDAEKISGKSIADLIVKPTSCSAGEVLSFDGSDFVCTTVSGGGSVTSSTIITALGYTPAASGSLSVTNAAVISALGYTPVASSSASVIAALGYTPAASGSVAVTNAAVLSALGYTPVASSSASVIAALGYTPAQSGGSIARSQIAAGTANHVLINDASGNVSSEAQLAVSRGGTGASSFTANSIVMTNGTGSALTSASCSSGEILEFNGTSWVCVSAASVVSGTGYVTSATAFVQNGNAFGATGTIGTTDSQALQFITNNSARMTISNAGAVGIGIASPNASSLVDITSTTKGLLIPRMTQAQRDAISSPATGLQVYNTDANTFDYYNGSAWSSLGVAGSGLTSLNGLTSSSQTFAIGTSGTSPAFSSATSTHTLNIPLASATGVTAGLLSKADYDKFTNKLDATNAAVVSALGYTPVASSSASVIAALGYTPAASGSVAVTNAAVLSALGYTPVASSSASVIEALGYTPAQSGGSIARSQIAAGTANHVLINDASGNVSSEAQLAVSRGGTGASSFAANTIVMTNGTGSALTSASCSIGEVLQYNGTSWACTSMSNATSGTGYVTSATAYVQGGNAFGASAVIGTKDAQSLELMTNNTTRAVIDSSGNVGIGTTAPWSILSVYSDQNADSEVALVNPNTGTSAGAHYSIYNNNANGYAFFGLEGLNFSGPTLFKNRAYLEAGADTDGLLLATDSTDPIIFATNSSERFRIASTGEVGIGTATPSTTALLEVSSTTKGILIPRMTSTQRDAIVSPVTGLQVYNTTTNSFDYYNGSAWTSLTSSGGAVSAVTSLNGLTAATQTFAIGTVGTSPAFSSATSTHTLNIPLASATGVTAGLLSKTDYDKFTNKLDATNAAVISALGFTPVASSSASVIQALGYTPAASGSFTVTSANVISALGYTPAQSGGTIARSQIATGTANYVLINDASGNVSSEAQLAVSRGGTGLSTYTPNALLMANGTGTALTSATCTAGQILQWTGLTWACVSYSSVASQTGFLQGGNSFGASATVGTTDAQSLQFITNNTARMTINSSGNVGVGTTSLSGAALNVGTAAAASYSGIKGFGAWYTSGDSTTNKPYLLIEPAGTTSNGWSTGGTGIGVNAASSFNGDLINLQRDGGKVFSVGANGGGYIGQSMQIVANTGALLEFGPPNVTNSVSDVIGEVTFSAVNSGWSTITAGNISTTITNVTPGTETSTMTFQTVSSGATANRMVIKGSNVGIGTSTPTTALTVSGAVTTAFSDISSATVDFSVANMIRTSAAAGTITINNLQDGTTNTLILSSAGSFTLSSSSISTWRCSPACPSGVIYNDSGHALITILKAGTTAYVTYIVEMQ